MPYELFSKRINRAIRDEKPDLPNNQAVRKFAVDKYKVFGLNTPQANQRAANKDAGHIKARNHGGQNKASNYMWEDRHDNRAHGDKTITKSQLKAGGRA
jgi:hypothetical protein